MPPSKIQSNGTGTGGGDDSDGEMSGNESERSGSSRDNEGGRDSSEGDEEVDSDDSSEMDERECEVRRNECMDNLTDLERQFTMLREQLYRERLAQVENQLIEVKGERSQEYLGPLQELEDNMKIRKEVARVLKEYRLTNITHQYKAELQAAQQNFESEKRLAWDFFHDELMDKIRRLEEDRHNVELSWGEASEWGQRQRSRSRRKAVTVTGPYIVYMLKPQDILEDWTIIRKALKRTP